MALAKKSQSNHLLGRMHCNAGIALKGAINGRKAEHPDGGNCVGQRHQQTVQAAGTGQMDSECAKCAEQKGNGLLKTQEGATLETISFESILWVSSVALRMCWNGTGPMPAMLPA